MAGRILDRRRLLAGLVAGLGALAAGCDEWPTRANGEPAVGPPPRRTFTGYDVVVMPLGGVRTIVPPAPEPS